MNKKIKLSLSIVTFNNSEIIVDTIENIISNLDSKYDYILYIIDNNSSDDTLKKLRKINQHIEIIELQDNKGFAHGHNQVLPLSSDYHFVINPDIRLIDKKDVNRMIDYMNNNPNVGLLSPLILNQDFSIQYLCKRNPTVWDLFIRRFFKNSFNKRKEWFTMRETEYNHKMNIEYASGCFMLFRSSVYNRIKGFDSNFFMYLEDADITRRVNEISSTIFFPDSKVIHFWERGSHKSFKLALITAKSMITYFRKWGWKLK